MKYLIIGSNGYIGRHLAKALNDQNKNFFCCDVASKSIDQYANYNQIDIRDIKQVKQLNFDVDVVFIFSGLTGTSASIKNYNDFIDINEKGLLNILDCIKNGNTKPHIVYPSTRLVYLGSENPLRETSTLEAKTIYASNKIACENYLKLFSDYYGISYSIFRICVPYGNLIDSAYSYGTIGFFISQAMDEKIISIYGDGKQKRTFSHVFDITMQILETIKHPESRNEVFNISGETYNLFEVANLIALKFDSKVDLLPWPEFDLKLESGSTFFESSKIESISNYKSKFNLAQWLIQI